jgi:hypothetical protein
MAGTLLQIVQDAMGECGFRVPTGVASNSNDESQTLLRLANRAGTMIADAFPWQALQVEGTITLVTAQQNYAMPSNFLFYSPETMWNRTDNRPVTIALTPEEWQYYKGWLSIGGLNLRARIQESEFIFDQTITAADNGKVLYFEFRSSAWCETSGGSPLDRFTSDTDVCKFNRDLMSSALKYLILKQRGLDWQLDYQEYMKKLRTHMGNDQAPRIATLGGKKYPILSVVSPIQGYGGV